MGNEPTLTIQHPTRPIHNEQHKAEAAKLAKYVKQGQENNNWGRDTKTVNKMDDGNKNVNKKASEQQTHLLKRKTCRTQIKKKPGEKKKKRKKTPNGGKSRNPVIHLTMRRNKPV